MSTFKFVYPKSWEVHGVLVYDTDKKAGKVRGTSYLLPEGEAGLSILRGWISELQDAYDKLNKETK